IAEPSNYNFISKPATEKYWSFTQRESDWASLERPKFEVLSTPSDKRTGVPRGDSSSAFVAGLNRPAARDIDLHVRHRDIHHGQLRNTDAGNMDSNSRASDLHGIKCNWRSVKRERCGIESHGGHVQPCDLSFDPRPVSLHSSALRFDPSHCSFLPG